MGIKSTIQNAVVYLKRRGIKAAVRESMERLHIVKPQINCLDDYAFIVDRTKIERDETCYLAHKDDEIKILNWIIPEPGKGSGGHLNIFRFISNLESQGFHSRVYVYRTPNYTDNETLTAFIRQYFPILDHHVEIFWDTKYAEFAHATIATSWQTAYFLNNFDNTISKFYFVQDFEPLFFPLGSQYEFAKYTYQMGFRGITAGDWLKNKLHDEFGMQTESFGFSYDKEIYTCKEKKDAQRRVFFYARPSTARREFELGLLALNELCKKEPDVEVWFAGEDISNVTIGFKNKSLGILPISKLSEVYSQCDLCFIISGTNLSLLPLEVMASGSVAVCSKGDNSTWLVNENNSILVDSDPVSMAETMQYYLNHPNKLKEIREKGIEFALTTSWVQESVKVREALLKGIQEDAK